MVEESMQTQS